MLILDPATLLNSFMSFTVSVAIVTAVVFEILGFPTYMIMSSEGTQKSIKVRRRAPFPLERLVLIQTLMWVLSACLLKGIFYYPLSQSVRGVIFPFEFAREG